MTMTFFMLLYITLLYFNTCKLSCSLPCFTLSLWWLVVQFFNKSHHGCSHIQWDVWSYELVLQHGSPGICSLFPSRYWDVGTILCFLGCFLTSFRYWDLFDSRLKMQTYGFIFFRDKGQRILSLEKQLHTVRSDAETWRNQNGALDREYHDKELNLQQTRARLMDTEKV